MIVVILGAMLMIGLVLAAGEPVVVHRCVGSEGVPRYQDQPCRGGDDDQRLELENRPVSAPPAAAESPATPNPPAPVEQPPPPVPSAPMSWRCEVENGEVYYRHDACPGFLVEPIGMRNRAGAAWGGMQYLRVLGTPVSRREACNAITDGVRLGAERDQRASPYEKLSGRDLCG